MENIGQGHWIFAACFAVVFIAYLIWSYRKDLKLHKVHYKGSVYVILVIIASAVLLYLFKGYLR